MTTTLKVLVTCPQMQRVIEQFQGRLEDAGIELDLPPVVQALSSADLQEIIGRYDGMIAGDDEVDAAVIARASRLRTIAKWGVGTDGIDKVAAAARGISVTNTPGAFGDEVADVALGYVILLARNLHRIHDSVRSDGWFKPAGITLSGTTLGVIGLGSIGRATARRGLGFGMHVVGYDPFLEARQGAVDQGTELVELEDLFSQSRFVILCCPLTAENHHMIDAKVLAAMRKDAYLVNVARGPLVDERALAIALADGSIAGAALDVFEVEPLPAASPLRDHPSVIFGSHNASNTLEATLRVSAMAVQNLLSQIRPEPHP